MKSWKVVGNSSWCPILLGSSKWPIFILRANHTPSSQTLQGQWNNLLWIWKMHQVMPVLAALAMCQSGTIYQTPELSELFKSALCQSAIGALSPFAHLARWRRIPFAQWLKSSKRHLDPITVIQFMLFMANAWTQSWSESLGRKWRTEASCRSNWKPCDRQKRIRSRGPLRLWEQRLCKGHITSLPRVFPTAVNWLMLFFGLWVFPTGSVPEFSQIRITRRISAVFHMGCISKPVTFSC